MKNKNSLVINSIIFFTVLLIFESLIALLKLKQLALTNLTKYSFILVLVILFLTLAAQIVIMLYSIAKKSSIGLKTRIASGAGACIGSVLIAFSILAGFFIFAFSYEPEHVVEKDGKRMVAYVNSFLQVNVYYFDYVNPFIRGSQIRISEDYGNGGYDPFEREQMPTVKRSNYYDENGQVTDSN